ncbi:hypothetical protein WN51_11200 [Melipona quadrifasciata]|uniref:Uncharacterized protein n=1 Tax=Melipona quadrifasciata TaxID=166423 RepID=A0A0M9A5C2_9HYME|nr:hypothetical protein WN51_11200 [Melipona quadrifasciata]
MKTSRIASLRLFKHFVPRNDEVILAGVKTRKSGLFRTDIPQYEKAQNKIFKGQSCLTNVSLTTSQFNRIQPKSRVYNGFKLFAFEFIGCLFCFHKTQFSIKSVDSVFGSSLIEEGTTYEFLKLSNEWLAEWMFVQVCTSEDSSDKVELELTTQIIIFFVALCLYI